MSRIKTVCSRDCYDTCSMVADVDKAGKLLSISADPENPVTGQFTCPRGTRDPKRLYTNRVQTPSLKKTGGFCDMTWDKAVDTIGARLEKTLDKHGPGAVLYLEYAGNQGLLSTAFPRRLWNALGATQTDMALCSRSGKQALRLHYGLAHGVFPMTVPSRDLIVFWGFNARVSAPHLWSLARQAARSSKVRLVVVDSRQSESSRYADVFIQPRPGTDVALACAVMKLLIDKNRADMDFIREQTTGFDHLKTLVAQWPVDKACNITGLDASDIHTLADLYGQSHESATLIGIGLQKCDQGADQVRAVSFIPAVLGQHRGFFYSNGEAFMVDQDLISGRFLSQKDHDTVQQVALSDIVNQGRFKFIYINCMNPAVTLPDQAAFRQGIARPDIFTVVHDTHWTQTASLADMVLPAPTFLEKEDVVLPWMHPYIRKSFAAVSPVSDSRTEAEVMCLVARRLSLPQPWLFEDPWQVLQTAIEPALDSGSFADLLSGKLLTLKQKPIDRYPTPSGKIEFYSGRAIDNNLPPMPVQASIETGTEFVLLNSATVKYTSTQFQEVFGNIPALVYIHPASAGDLGIESGWKAVLENPLGRVLVRILVSKTVPENVLWMPRQALDLNGIPMNCLISGIPQSIGSGGRYNSTRVTITPVPS